VQISVESRYDAVRALRPIIGIKIAIDLILVREESRKSTPTGKLYGALVSVANRPGRKSIDYSHCNGSGQVERVGLIRVRDHQPGKIASILENRTIAIGKTIWQVMQIEPGELALAIPAAHASNLRLGAIDNSLQRRKQVNLRAAGGTNINCVQNRSRCRESRQQLIGRPVNPGSKIGCRT